MDVIEGTTVINGSSENSLCSFIRSTGIAGKTNLPLIFGFQKVGPGLRNILDDVGVHFEGQNAIVIYKIEASGVFATLDGIPGGNLIGSEQVWAGGVLSGSQRTICSTNIENIRGLWAFILHVIFDGLDLISGTAIRIDILNLDAIFGGEIVHHIAIIAPIAGQGDDGQVTFSLSCGDQGIHATAISGRLDGRPIDWCSGWCGG